MTPTLEILISLRKCIRYHNPNLKYPCILNYECLFTLYVSFISTLNFMYISMPTCEVMIELVALYLNNTWEIVLLSPNKTKEDHQHVYTMKVGLYGYINCFSLLGS